MIKKNIFEYLFLFSVLIFTNYSNICAQQDTLIITKTLTGITDSSSQKDSTQIQTKRKFFVRFFESTNDNELANYELSKKQIDFTDYKYSGNILGLIPFGNLNDFGSLGSPSEANIFSFGYGNISLIIDETDLSNRWNNSIDMNRLLTESINKFSVVPITRSFLRSFSNNPSLIFVKTIDSIKSKPISRIRYYQSPNEEGFIDAFFSARAISRLTFSIRFTNSSVDNFYDNSDFGSWKLNLKGTYKVDDSIFASLSYDHLKLNTPLNGGIDVKSITSNSSSDIDIYPTTNPVVYQSMKNETTNNRISSNIYGNLLPFGFTKLTLHFQNDAEQYSFPTDSIDRKEDNNYRLWHTSIVHDVAFSNFSLIANASYEHIDYNIEGIEYNDKVNNYFGSLLLKYPLVKNRLIPTVYGKLSNYNGQNAKGYGGDLSFIPFEGSKIFLGYSHFNKPYSIAELKDLSIKDKQDFNNLFASIEYFKGNFRTSISYFYSKVKNFAMPLLNLNGTNTSINEVVFLNENSSELNGINLNASIESWNILLEGNLNYYMHSNFEYKNNEKILNTRAGLFYVDTLYNTNLDLKTGFIFYFNNDPNYYVYDFRKMQKASYSIRDNSIEKLPYYPAINDRLRLDFYLAGRIQDAATFYFIYENVFSNKYFIVPYYPMPEGGIRIGISWDFLD